MDRVSLTLRLFKALGIFSVFGWLTRRKLRILCYHGLWYGDGSRYGDCLYMDPETFAERMSWLSRSGYPVLSLDDALRRLDDGSLPDRSIVITIDDGWYSTYRGMVPVLKSLSLPATVYVTTYYVKRGGPVLNVLLDYLVENAPVECLRYELIAPEVEPPPFLPHSVEGKSFIASTLARTTDAIPDFYARLGYVKHVAGLLQQNLDALLASRQFSLMNADELRQTHDAGVDIQLHTHTHRMHGMDSRKVAAEIELNRSQLANMIKRDPRELRHFCFPSGVYSNEVFDTLRAVGIESATTTESGLAERQQERMRLPRILDCESMSQLEFEARLCGIWDALEDIRSKAKKLVGTAN